MRWGRSEQCFGFVEGNCGVDKHGGHKEHCRASVGVRLCVCGWVLRAWCGHWQEAHHLAIPGLITRLKTEAEDKFHQIRRPPTGEVVLKPQAAFRRNKGQVSLKKSIEYLAEKTHRLLCWFWCSEQGFGFSKVWAKDTASDFHVPTSYVILLPRLKRAGIATYSVPFILII